jgi:hypothetical protein
LTRGPFALRGVLIVLALVGLGTLLSNRTVAREAEAPSGEIRLRSIMGGQSWSAPAGIFRGGAASSLMGGMVLDLRRAEMEEDSVVLDLHVVMGGARIFVPDHWVVVTDVMPIFGGVGNRTRTPDAVAAPELIVRGSVLMGGLEIRN